MDTKKLKKYLIILLVFTNLAIGFTIIQDYLLLHTSNKSGIYTLYAKKNVGLEFEKTVSPSKLTGLNITIIEFDDSYAAAKLGQNLETVDNQTFISGENTIYSNKKDFIFTKTDVFEDIYRFLIVKPQPKTTQNIAHMDSSTAYLQNERFDSPTDIQYIGTFTEGIYTISKFSFAKDGFLFDDSCLLVWEKSGEFVGYTISSMPQIIQPNDKEYDLISIEEMLFKLYNQFESGDTITTLELVYKLSDTNLISQDIVEGEALPYYKVVDQTGKAIYIPAYKR